MTVSIRKPCSENWDTFEKSGNTGFCSSCQKQVVDFTKFSDNEILHFFKNNQGKTCGRFLPGQLKTYSERKESGFNAAAAILAAGILTISQVPSAVAQTSELSYVLKGQIRERDTDYPIVGASIVIKGTHIGTISDVNGNFTLGYSTEKTRELTVVTSFVGYTTLEATVNVSGPEADFGYLGMDPDVTVLGGADVCYSWYTPRGIWSRVISIFRKR